MDGTTVHAPLVSRGRWRAVASAVCIVLAAILVPVSIVGAWARVQLVDEAAFVATLAPLIDEPEVQALIIDETTSAIRAQVDFAAVTDELFDGIAELGLPPRASGALDLLRAPAADGLANLVDAAVAKVVASEVFSDVWETTVQGAHRALTLVSTGAGGGVIVREGDDVGIALGPMIASVKVSMVERGIGVAALIPTVERTIVIGNAEGLATARSAHSITVTVGGWMPVITAALFALGIVFARRRPAAVLGTGIGLALGAGALGIGLAIGSPLLGGAGEELGLAPAGLTAMYAHLVGAMQVTAWAFTAIGVLVAVGGWFLKRRSAKTEGAILMEHVDAEATR